MEDKLYTKDDFEYAMKLIGQTAHFFVKTQLAPQPDATHWAYLPMIGVALGKTEIIGVHAEIERKADKNGVKEMYRKLQFILRNPYYEKQDEPEERDGPSWPKVDMHTGKEWNLAFMTLNSWLFLEPIKAWSKVETITGMYYAVK